MSCVTYYCLRCDTYAGGGHPPPKACEKCGGEEFGREWDEQYDHFPEEMYERGE